MSRIGKMPVAIPAGVEVTVADGNLVTVKGPKGTLTQQLQPSMTIKQEGAELLVSRPDDGKENRALHGLTRALLHNMVVGVTDGYKKTLEVNGVGYRAAKEGNKLVLNIGYSHAVEVPEIDGIMGVAVAAFILWSGWGLVMDTLSPLLGESPSPELVEHIEQTVMGYPGVLGMHDLMVHDYGPGHQFASLHIEFPAETDPLKAHDVIDNIENDFIKRDGLQVTIHYDPIVTTDAAVGVLRTRLMEKARQLDPCLSIHDLRIVPGDTHTNVLFDLEFPAGYTGNKDEMLAAMCQFVHEQDPKYSCVVKVEQSYASAAHEK